MDMGQIVDQVVEHVKEAPEKIKDVIADPKGAIEGITGQDLDDVDLGEIVGNVKDKLGEAGVDVTEFLGDAGENIADAVKGLFGKIVGKDE